MQTCTCAQRILFPDLCYRLQLRSADLTKFSLAHLQTKRRRLHVFLASGGRFCSQCESNAYKQVFLFLINDTYSDFVLLHIVVQLYCSFSPREIITKRYNPCREKQEQGTKKDVCDCSQMFPKFIYQPDRSNNPNLGQNFLSFDLNLKFLLSGNKGCTRRCCTRFCSNLRQNPLQHVRTLQQVGQCPMY